MTPAPNTEEHWRMELNNILQKNKALGTLKYTTSPAPGTQHQGPWTAVATVNGIEYGRGQGNSIAAAKEAAAQQAYEAVVERLNGN